MARPPRGGTDTFPPNGFAVSVKVNRKSVRVGKQQEGFRRLFPSRVAPGEGVALVSRFSRTEFPRMHVVFDSAALRAGPRAAR